MSHTVRGYLRSLGAPITLVSVALVFAVTACGAPQAGQASSSTTTPANAQSTQAPAFDLTAEGHARQVIDFLVAASGNKPVLRVEVTPTAANITYLEDDQAHTIGYANGHISPVDSTVKYINQAQFKPSGFNIDNVGELFEKAGEISGSRQQQDLQINEYNQGVVLMTVTTTPETSTVFFRPDGSIVNKLDFSTDDGIREGLSDTVQGASRVEQVVIKPDSLSADVRTDAATIQRRTRQRALPSITSNIKDSSDPGTFDPALIDPGLIARLEQTLPATVGRTPSTSVTVTIAQHAGQRVPFMYFQFSGAEVVTTMAGDVIAK
ncbi:Hypothetical protein PFR_JS9-2_676 [Propionibacterium freudenreichii]|jgi:hypothetical protein|uniref:hypothetical protein n=1 Tax=Propionibacterium freudenreichii TaxID=1744 RepID=UPI000BC2C7BC|nr:hypothetical protein [Propionibacterium freudenreichii]SCQ60524.1 Hypothetical protein PFR_JS9-1_678 [Propionibacterium freudenreichii]SCQ67434.1 Hypothetical protein PFR_JS9-2_676 [Propionibacterium freudenreichii]